MIVIKDIIKAYKQHRYNNYKKELLLKKFYYELECYNKMADKSQEVDRANLYPCLNDATEITPIEPVYFYQDAWAFERILSQKPKTHIDIGSHHKFVALLSKTTDLTMVDLRPLSLEMPSINFKQGDILNLPFDDCSIDSLSSLCVIEHIGLGRYGDKLDPKGSEKAFTEINRILKEGSNFYMSVPVESENRTYFNAHRAFSEEFLLEKLLSNYQVVDRSYIYGKEFSQSRQNKFGIGCYHLRKY